MNRRFLCIHMPLVYFNVCALLLLAVGAGVGWTVRRFASEDLYLRTAADSYRAERYYYAKQADAIIADAKPGVERGK